MFEWGDDHGFKGVSVPEVSGDQPRRLARFGFDETQVALDLVYWIGIRIAYWNTYCALGLVLRGCLYGAYLESYAYVGGGNVGQGMGWACTSIHSFIIVEAIF